MNPLSKTRREVLSKMRDGGVIKFTSQFRYEPLIRNVGETMSVKPVTVKSLERRGLIVLCEGVPYKYYTITTLGIEALGKGEG